MCVWFDAGFFITDFFFRGTAFFIVFFLLFLRGGAPRFAFLDFFATVKLPPVHPKLCQHVLTRMGIADQVKPKIRFVSDTHTTDYVARGDAEIAVQLANELLEVPGIEVVPLPPEFQTKRLHLCRGHHKRFQGARGGKIINPISDRSGSPACDQSEALGARLRPRTLRSEISPIAP